MFHEWIQQLRIHRMYRQDQLLYPPNVSQKEKSKRVPIQEFVPGTLYFCTVTLFTKKKVTEVFVLGIPMIGNNVENLNEYVQETPQSNIGNDDSNKFS